MASEKAGAPGTGGYVVLREAAVIAYLRQPAGFAMAATAASSLNAATAASVVLYESIRQKTAIQHA